MQKISFWVILLSLSFLSGAFASESLEIGSSAPPIKVDEWIQGSPLASFKKGEIYVVEFWATWCPPCVESIPHLNELNKKYSGRVNFIGIAASERGINAEEQRKALDTFFQSKKAPIEYSHAFDSSGQMMALWGDAAGEAGIPHAFIIDKKGNIAAIAHPMLIGEILEEIVSDRWEQNGGMKKHQQERLHAKKLNEQLDDIYSRLHAELKNQNWAKVLEITEEGIALKSGATLDFQSVRARMLISHLGRIDEGLSLATEIISQSMDSPQGLGAMLVLLVDPNIPPSKQNLKLAQEIADRIENHFEQEKPEYVQYRFAFYPPVAEYYFRTGKLEKAILIQKQALETLPERYKDMEKEMLSSLKKYEEVLSTPALECKNGVCEIPPSTEKCSELLSPK